METERIALTLQMASSERHPPEGFLAAIAQVGLLFLRTRRCILLANLRDRVGMNTKLLAAASRELVQVEASGPALVPLERMFLGFVAVVPDVVDCPGLLVQQSVQRLHPVAVSKNHGPILL
ncbi:MAG: hypothetical protein DDT34_02175 [Firmicutes bacterium]|nr:hypothetical protein [Bacillota bacterium]